MTAKILSVFKNRQSPVVGEGRVRVLVRFKHNPTKVFGFNLCADCVHLTAKPQPQNKPAPFEHPQGRLRPALRQKTGRPAKPGKFISLSCARGSEAASLGLLTVAPASVPVLFPSSGRISRAVPRFGLPSLGAKKKNRHGGRRYGQGPGSCLIRTRWSRWRLFQV